MVRRIDPYSPEGQYQAAQIRSGNAPQTNESVQGMVDSAIAANQVPPGEMGYNKDIEKSWQPGVQQATNIYNEGLPPLDPNNYLANTMSSLNAGNPYADQLGGFDPNNPALNALGGFDPNNPYTNQIGGFDATNQELGGFNQFMPGNTNPYADRMFNIGADQIQDQINSQFGSSGQGSSSGNLNEQISRLGDYGAKFYGGIYDNDMNRGLQATQGLSNAYQDQNALGLNALGMAQSGWLDSNQQDLAARGMGIDAYAGQDAQRLQALQAAGGMDQNALNSAASFLPGMLSQIQNQPYSNLDQYSQIVSRLTGTSPQQQEQEKASGFDKLIGLGSMLGGLGGTAGIKGLFG